MNTILRTATYDDLPFIYSTWLKGLYHGNSLYRKIDQGVFYEKYHQVLEALLNRSNVRLVCLADEPDVILGYCVHSDRVLHWVFVKKAWRGKGIAKTLIPDNTTTVSHLTKSGESIMKKKKPEWKFNPFL